MYMQSNSIIHHTAKPVVAGIFDIIIGALFVLSTLFIGFGMLWVSPFGSNFPVLPKYLTTIALYFIGNFGILGILSIIGGVYNLRRRMWGLALAGSIATAIFIGWGAISIVLTYLSKEEFA